MYVVLGWYTTHIHYEDDEGDLYLSRTIEKCRVLGIANGQRGIQKLKKKKSYNDNYFESYTVLKFREADCPWDDKHWGKIYK